MEKLSMKQEPSSTHHWRLNRNMNKNSSHYNFKGMMLYRTITKEIVNS